MKLKNVLLENDVYNQNQKLKQMVEQMIPQLHAAIIQKIKEDKYEDAATLLNKLKMVAGNCAIQIKSFKPNDQSTAQSKILDTEL